MALRFEAGIIIFKTYIQYIWDSILHLETEACSPRENTKNNTVFIL